MKKLLILIGANVLMITTVSPMVINYLNPNITTNTKNFANKEDQLHGEITISNSKHKNNDEVIIGTKDYKEEFTKSINAIRAQLIKENAINITVSNIETKFKNVPYPGKIEVPTEAFSKLLTAKTVEITAVEVTIGRAGPAAVTYQILYSAIIDGKQINRVNINGYGRQVFLGSHVTSPYIITFDVNYKKQEHLHSQITISNSKHKNNDEVIIGTKDYKEEFTKSINAIRAQLIKENAINITVSNIETKLKNIPYPGKVEVPTEAFSKLLTAKTVEITAVEVTIGRAGPAAVTYQILYSAIIDGKQINRVNINGYGRQVFLGSHVTSPYIITFDVNYYKK